MSFSDFDVFYRGSYLESSLQRHVDLENTDLNIMKLIFTVKNSTFIMFMLNENGFTYICISFFYS